MPIDARHDPMKAFPNSAPWSPVGATALMFAVAVGLTRSCLSRGSFQNPPRRIAGYGAGLLTRATARRGGHALNDAGNCCTLKSAGHSAMSVPCALDR